MFYFISKRRNIPEPGFLFTKTSCLTIYLLIWLSKLRYHGDSFAGILNEKLKQRDVQIPKTWPGRLFSFPRLFTV
ncbi:hypothetical protein LY78DRAFT_465709 [Colletotrichum sublineola]|nr:hypothetical protein LY78DRAFT_465709 [Colletotrichum sublineola]